MGQSEPDDTRTIPEPDAREKRLPWFALSVIVGVLLLGALMWLLSVPLPPYRAPEFPKPLVSIDVSSGAEIGGGLLGEQAALFDTEPLFLPTRWNAGRARSALEIAHGRAPSPFSTYDLRIAPDAEALPAALVDAPPVLLTPESLLSARHTDFFAQFGKGGNVHPLSERSALLRVIQGSKTIAEVVLRGRFSPELDGTLWSPLDFMVLVGPDGELVGEPLLQGTTGNEAVDEALRALVRGHLEGRRLGEGHFKVSIMP